MGTTHCMGHHQSSISPLHPTHTHTDTLCPSPCQHTWAPPPAGTLAGRAGWAGPLSRATEPGRRRGCSVTSTSGLTRLLLLQQCPSAVTKPGTKGEEEGEGAPLPLLCEPSSASSSWPPIVARHWSAGASLPCHWWTEDALRCDWLARRPCGRSLGWGAPLVMGGWSRGRSLGWGHTPPSGGRNLGGSVCP